MIGHGLHAHGHAQFLGNRQNLGQTAAEQLLCLLAGGARRLVAHLGGFGADAAGTQRLADCQLALEVGHVLQASRIIDGKFHIGAQHGNLNVVGLFGGDGVIDQRLGYVRVAFYGRHTFFVGQLHGGKAIGRHTRKQLVRRAFAVVMQAGSHDKFWHSGLLYFFCAARISV